MGLRLNLQRPFRTQPKGGVLDLGLKPQAMSLRRFAAEKNVVLATWRQGSSIKLATCPAAAEKEDISTIWRQSFPAKSVLRRFAAEKAVVSLFFFLTTLLLSLLFTAPLCAEFVETGAQQKGLQGTIHLSNGEARSGKVFGTSNQQIVMALGEGQKTKKVRFTVEEIATFKNTVEEEKMQEEWTFKEGGKDEKVFSGRKYPERWYLTEVVLKDGTKYKGHTLSALVYLDDGGEKGPAKFQLQRSVRGEVGQTLEDLVYIESITLEGAEVKAWSGKIVGDLALKADLKKVQVRAFGVNTGEFTEGRVTENGTFEICGLREEPYDLLIETESTLYIGFSWSKKVNADKPELTEEDQKKLQADILQVADYFDTREFLKIIGRGDQAHALMRQVRTNSTSEGKQDHERIAIFCIQKAGETWRLTRQIFVTRQGTGKEVSYVKKPVLFLDKLSGIEVGPQVELKTIRLTGEEK